MKKPGRREVKWFAHGHTDSAGQNHGCISDRLTPGCGLFVLYFIAACSWCRFKEVSRGLSIMEQEWKEELQEAQKSWNHESSGQAGTSKGQRIKLCKGHGKFWYCSDRKQFWAFTPVSRATGQPQEQVHWIMASKVWDLCFSQSRSLAVWGPRGQDSWAGECSGED